jgi:hypothetical protein
MRASHLKAYRARYAKPHERAILDWVEVQGDLDGVAFYPRDNPTILLTWTSEDEGGRLLFREIDVIVDGDGAVHVSGGATYHEPTYRIAWLPYTYVQADDLEATLDAVKQEVEALGLADLTDMDEYIEALNASLED